jgi:hypothetical protein
LWWVDIRKISRKKGKAGLITGIGLGQTQPSSGVLGVETQDVQPEIFGKKLLGEKCILIPRGKRAIKRGVGEGRFWEDRDGDARRLRAFARPPLQY